MVYALFHRTWQYNELYIGWAIEFTKLPASGRTKTWMTKLMIDEGWLAGFQNCPPQGNPGGGLTKYSVLRPWREGGWGTAIACNPLF